MGVVHSGDRFARSSGAVFSARPERWLRRIARVLATGTGMVLGLGFAPLLSAQGGDDPDGPESSKRRYEIPPGPLDRVLAAFAARSDRLLSIDPELVRDRVSPGLRGTFSVEEGFAALLADTGLEARPGEGRLVVLRAASGTPTGTIEVIGHSPEVDARQSASRTALSLRETPQSVTVVTREKLDERQVQELGQALESVAGIAAYGGPGPFRGVNPFGYLTFQMRGFASAGAYDLRDDGFIASERFSHADLAVYDRIEVVKGPVSVLNGRGEVGGYINRIRKKPLPDYRAELSSTVGSYDEYRLDADVTGPMFSAGATRGRMIAAAEHSGSFVHGIDSALTLVAPSIAFDPAPGTHVQLLGHWQDLRFEPDPGIPLKQDGDYFRAPDISRRQFLGVPNPNFDGNYQKLRVGTAQVDQELGDHWLATLRVNRAATRQKDNQDRYVYNYGDQTIPGGDVNLYSGIGDFDGDLWAGDLRLKGSGELFGRAAGIAVGVDGTRRKGLRHFGYAYLGLVDIYDRNFRDFPTVQPDLVPDAEDRTYEHSYGVDVEASIRPFERLTVLLGGRFDHVDGLRSRTESAVPPSAVESAFTGRIGSSFAVTPDLSVYALFSQSFQPQLFALDQDGHQLAAERGQNLEGGAKAALLGGRLSLTAALFSAQLDKTAIPAPGLDVDYSIEGGLLRSEGFELEIAGRPLPGWDVSFAGTRLETRYVERDDPLNHSLAPGAAKWQGQASTSYELQGGTLHGLGFGVSAFAIGDRGISNYIPRTRQRGYERCDFSVFYRGIRHIEFRLQVRNVFDERYVESADRTFGSAAFGSPTAVLATIRYVVGSP